VKKYEIYNPEKVVYFCSCALGKRRYTYWYMQTMGNCNVTGMRVVYRT